MSHLMVPGDGPEPRKQGKEEQVISSCRGMMGAGTEVCMAVYDL